MSKVFLKITRFSSFASSLLKLMRLEKPTGFLLLYLPSAWGLTLASSGFPSLKYLCLLLLGAIVMRGAGCTYNDIVDRDIDQKVHRTADRPLASGKITRLEATVWFFCQLFFGLMILLALPSRVWGIALGAIPIVLVYPWVKRFSYWPQLVLGFAFNWGALVGGMIPSPAAPKGYWGLYLAGVFWTLAYDTIYAHQDLEDDLQVGVKSTAVYFKEKSKTFIISCYSLMMLCLVYTGLAAQQSGKYFLFLGVAFLSSLWLVFSLRLENSSDCLRAFKLNIYLGVLILLGLLSHKL